eukprot:COSAG05_NODE_2219_length_3375_cov_231.829879_5_plen_116_part_00
MADLQLASVDFFQSVGFTPEDAERLISSAKNGVMQKENASAQQGREAVTGHRDSPSPALLTSMAAKRTVNVGGGNVDLFGMTDLAVLKSDGVVQVRNMQAVVDSLLVPFHACILR